MNKTLVILMVSLLTVRLAATTGALSEAEAKVIKKDITHLLALFEKGDAQALLDQTHESIYPLAGGSKEAFDKLTKAAAEQIMHMDIKFLESEMGEPTEVYAAGRYEVCFAPRVSIIEVKGKKVKSIGFMIAARTTGQDSWKYLDGAALRKHPEMLAKLFPELDPKVKLPPNKVELL